jgi:peptidyl-dipeptidase Dcp
MNKTVSPAPFAADAAASNPLLSHWSAPHGLPPFGALAPAHFAPALEQAMREQRAELTAIANDPAAPNFANTVVAFDRAGHLLDQLASVFYALTAAATSPALEAVQREMAAPLAAHDNAVYMDAAVFARVQTVFASRHSAGLDAQAQRLVERVHLDFLRAGAALQGAAQKRYAQVMEELAQLNTRFAQNVLHDESTWTLALQGEDALAGLPSFVRDAARQAGAERGLTGPVITLSRSLIVPFLSFSERRDLRETAWRAWVGRGEHAGEHDNRELVRSILRLRHEQASLHGHVCYADYALADTMAGSRAAVAGLLEQVWPRALVAVERERELLEAARRKAPSAAGTQGAIEAWDWRYWAEKVRREHFAVDDAEVKPYFKLENVVTAAFDCAQRLFGLRFTARADLPVYHPDVVAYEVHNAQGAMVGVFLQDNFARTTKRSGAWMNALRWQARNNAGGAGAAGAATLPIIQNNNNFAKGAPGAPTLLSLDDARTLFHEFGHGLHGLLSNVDYRRLSGTQVLRDFVELPSQLFEHWITEPQVLQQHARHWQTGEPIPLALIQKLKRAAQFGQGYETVRYCASALIDMAVHSSEQREPAADLSRYETDFLNARGLPPGVGQNHRLVHFQHLFSSSGYAAGYYVYLWAEVLDADGYGAFKEANDPFDPHAAARLLRYIYSSGNSLEPGAAYAAFRGRPATVQPLLHKRGLMNV